MAAMPAAGAAVCPPSAKQVNRMRTRWPSLCLTAVALLGVTLLPPRPLRADDRAPGPADKDRKVRVACVGDSITFGSGIPDREHNAYPAQLANLLGDRYEVRNFGVSGATLLK